MNKCLFKPIQYKKNHYPNNISPEIIEITATHSSFSSEKIIKRLRDSNLSQYSLHTEPYNSAKFSSAVYKVFQNNYMLKKLNQTFLNKGLWIDKEWANEFATFINFGINQALKFNSNLSFPTIIEIHPPFKNTIKTISEFLNNYEVFEKNLSYKKTTFLIENRNSSRRFLIQTSNDIKLLSEQLNTRKLIKLKVIADIPQLVTAICKEKNNPENVINSIEDIDDIFNPLIKCRNNIFGIHISGKSHRNNIDTLFYKSLINFDEIKECFFRKLIFTFSDNQVRYFLPEVNGNYNNLVQTLINYGIIFV